MLPPSSRYKCSRPGNMRIKLLQYCFTILCKQHRKKICLEVNLYLLIFRLFPLFKRNKSRLMGSPCCLCVSPSINYCMPVPIFMKLGIYIMTSEPISTAYSVNPSQQSVQLYVCSPIVARQRLGKNVIAATNTQATKEEFLYTSFSMLSVSYQRRIGD
jgi:hypothetical protein